MTEHDRIVFDLRGYIVKPAVLSEGEVAELREFVLRQRREPESLPPHQRRLPGGPFERLIDTTWSFSSRLATSIFSINARMLFL